MKRKGFPLYEREKSEIEGARGRERLTQERR